MSMHPPTPEEQAAISANNCVPLTRKITSVLDLSADRALTQDNIPDGTTYKQYNPAALAITGGTATGLTELGVRDTSAAFDVDIAATSSTVLTAKRTLTVDMVNASRTLKVSGNAEVSGTNTGDQTVTGLGLDAVAADQVAGARGLTQVHGTLGTPAAIYDVAGLDCDTKGGFDVDFFTVSGVGGTPSAVAVRINGSDTANLIWLAQRYATSGLVLNVATSWIAGWSAYNSGDVVCARISCETPHSNVHGVRIRVSAIHIAAGTAIYFTTLNGWYKPASPTEIVSVGLANTVGTEQFTATSSHILTRRVAP